MNSAEFMWIDEHIRWHLGRRRISGPVVEKVSDGRTLMVKPLGWGPTPVQVWTERNIWGAARVGDIVEMRTGHGPLIATGTFESRGPANTMQRVGEDNALGQTTSASTYADLLDVTGLVVSAEAASEVFWTTESVAVGSTGAAGKQIRLVLNDEAGIDLTFGTGSHIQSAERAFISPLAGDFDSPARLVGGQVGQWIYASGEGEINRVRLQGRTNDTEQENDILRAQGLAVFA